MVFVRRPLESEARTLGERLRLLRRTQAVTMDMLVAATRVQRRYLEALEWGRYHELPEPLYARNFIRSYARYLGADEAYFLELFASEVAQSDLLAPHRLPRSRVHASVLRSWPHIFAGLGIASVFFLGVFWIFSRIVVIFHPPEVVIITPEKEMVVTEPFITVHGTVGDMNVTVDVDNKRAALAPDGSFTERVPLHVGVNILSISARGRYSSDFMDERIVVYAPEDVDK